MIASRARPALAVLASVQAALLALVPGCFTVPVHVRGPDAARRVQFEVAWSTEAPPDARVLDELCARVRDLVSPGVAVGWHLGERVEARETWTERSQEDCAREHRRDEGEGCFFIHWSSGRFDEPAGGAIRMAHSWGGDATAVYADVVQSLPDVRPSTLLLHELGHNLGLVGVGLEERSAARRGDPGGHCPDPACVMYRLPLAQGSFCKDCLFALEHAR